MTFKLFAAIKEYFPERVTMWNFSRLHSCKERKPALKLAKAGLVYWKEAGMERILSEESSFRKVHFVNYVTHFTKP